MIRFIACLCIILHTVVASAGELINRVWLPTFVGAYRIDVYAPTGDIFEPGILSIKCLKNCPKPVRYIERLGASLVSVYTASDSSDLVYVLEAGGSASHVRIYNIDKYGVHKVLSKGSRGDPQYYVDMQGRETLITYDRGRNDEPGVSFQQTWFWDGHRFRKGKRVRLHLTRHGFSCYR